MTTRQNATAAGLLLAAREGARTLNTYARHHDVRQSHINEAVILARQAAEEVIARRLSRLRVDVPVGVNARQPGDRGLYRVQTPKAKARRRSGHVVIPVGVLGDDLLHVEVSFEKDRIIITRP